MTEMITVIAIVGRSIGIVISHSCRHQPAPSSSADS